MIKLLFRQYLVQKCQHILVELLAVQLVVHFVAAVRIELEAHILHPSSPEGLPGLPYALAVAAHRVLVAADEEHGQVLGHLGQVCFVLVHQHAS